MNHQAIARILLTAFCVLQGAATMALDLNRTHAAHPRWLGHARFHVVWQTATVALLSILEVVLIWGHRLPAPEQFYAAALLASLPIFGFFTALLTIRIYGGALSDPGGIPPLKLTLGGRVRRIDLNLVAEIAGLMTITFLVILYRH